MLEVQVMAMNTIKPSYPTPHHLRKFKLSFIDQAYPRMYTRLALFYNNIGIEKAESLCKLKNSLSETLTKFYPLAGRIIGDETVECNDEGVDFLEAQVKGQLSEYLATHDLELLDQLLPCDILHAKSGNDVLLAVQVNAFDCGGLAIGVGLSHKLADAASMATFVNTWAAIGGGSGEVVGPTFDSAMLFPAIEVPQPLDSRLVLQIKKDISTKRFVFSPSNITALRAATHDGKHATRVEAVSALIWRCLIRARSESKRALVVLHAMNIRKRMVPPLPEYSFGNLVIGALTAWVPMEEEEQHENLQHCLEKRLRNAITQIDSEYIKEMQGPHRLFKAYGPVKAIIEKYSEYGVDLCIFSSWCRFPLYEVDFGWGKPIWATIGQNFTKDTIFLMETRSGDGIEARVCLEEKDMVKFEKDQELLSFVSFSNTG